MEKCELEKLKAMEFLSKIFAHDIRTPLSTVIMMLNSIDRDINSNEIDVKKISKKIQKSKFLLSEILFFIKMKVMNLQIPIIDQAEKLDIVEIVKEAIQKYPLSEMEMSLISVHYEQTFYITAMKEIVLQIMFNLLDNALQQIRTSSKGNIEISIKSNKKYNELCFKDTASHIPESERSKMFNLRLDYSSYRIGLGLYFCKNAMLAMGGNIFYRTCIDGFPEFSIIFPK